MAARFVVAPEKLPKFALARRRQHAIISGVTQTETPRIRTTHQVMFFDTDCAAVVHNIAYLRFIEVARTLLAEQLGMGLRDMAESQQFPVVVRTEIDYKSPARLGDTVVVDGWLEKFERVRFWCGFKLTRASDEALIAESRQALALIQMPAGKVMRLPADWPARFGRLG
ncbi:MAG: acyl-CoA thioesterase [Verrucomicrobiota bacterium]|nr:acyl-CoA thioesterase [Verrucomicrobiota bacterium]